MLTERRLDFIKPEEPMFPRCRFTVLYAEFLFYCIAQEGHTENHHFVKYEKVKNEKASVVDKNSFENANRRSNHRGQKLWGKSIRS